MFLRCPEIKNLKEGSKRLIGTNIHIQIFVIQSMNNTLIHTIFFLVNYYLFIVPLRLVWLAKLKIENIWDKKIHFYEVI